MPSIKLRPITLRDRDRFFEHVLNSRKLHHPWVRPPQEAPAFRKWVLRPDGESLVVCRGREWVGVINLNQIIYGLFCNSFLGYYAFAPLAGRGYMREGMEKAIRYAFRKLKLHRLEANIQPANKSSIRLVQRCGFRKEGFSPRYLKINGRWRDHERWAITSEDF